MKKINFTRLMTFLALMITSTVVLGQGPTSFAAGAAVIDMGISPQTDNNALKPYGLVFALVEEGIPVNWIIDEAKTYGNGSIDRNEKVDDSDLAVSNAVFTNKPLYGGPFLIKAQYMTAATKTFISNWIAANNATGLTIYYDLYEIPSAPVYGIINNFPNVVIYDNGKDPLDIVKGFYARAGITTGYRSATPDNILDCEQFYVLSHHTDPDDLGTNKWQQAINAVKQKYPK